LRGCWQGDHSYDRKRGGGSQEGGKTRFHISRMLTLEQKERVKEGEGGEKRRQALNVFPRKGEGKKLAGKGGRKEPVFVFSRSRRVERERKEEATRCPAAPSS